MNDYELYDKLTAGIDTLKFALEYKIEKVLRSWNASPDDADYLRTLCDELDTVRLKLEREHLEYREQHIQEHINEEDQELWLELRWARAKVEELEERVQESIEDDAKELLQELDEVQEKLEELNASGLT